MAWGVKKGMRKIMLAGHALRTCLTTNSGLSYLTKVGSKETAGT